MALGFLQRLFSRGEAEESPDLSGPLSLLPGARVEYYQQRLVVKGSPKATSSAISTT